MIKLFGQKTLETLITPVVGRTFNSGDVGGYGHVFLQELGIDDQFEGKKPRARVVAHEAVRQLSCDSRSGRQAARDSLTYLLISPGLIERDAGRVIRALIGSWRKDLREALQSAFLPEQITESATQFRIRVDKGAPRASCDKVQDILFKEHEHTDWILRLLASRSAAFRGELESAEAQLTAFHQQRADTTIKLVGKSFAEEVTIFKPERISIKDDQAFLEELHHRLSVYQEQLRQANFPFLLSDVVERQILVPAATIEAIESLGELKIPPGTLSLSPNELQEGSPEEFFEARKEDAVTFMKSVAVEAEVFHHRINYRPQRCVALEKLPPIDVPREVEVAQIGENLRGDLVKIVRDSEIEERIVSNLLSEFNSYLITAPEPLDTVLCFSCYIPASDTMGQ